MTVTLQRGGQIVATLSLDDGPLYIGRAHAILKRTLNADDVTIPRRAMRLDVDPNYAGTLNLCNCHDKIQLDFELPDGGKITLRAQESMAIPSGITLWKSIKLIYELAEPNIRALDTQDEDMTDDEEERLGSVSGGEAQPRDDWLLRMTQPSQSL